MKTKTPKQPKQVVIIARVQFKADSRKVAYAVESSDGTKQYSVCLFDGKVTACDCPARKPCKHMNAAQRIETARTAHVAAHGDIAGFNVCEPVSERVSEPVEVAAAAPAEVVKPVTPQRVQEDWNFDDKPLVQTPRVERKPQIETHKPVAAAVWERSNRSQGFQLMR